MAHYTPLATTTDSGHVKANLILEKNTLLEKSDKFNIS
jgi:hypothetical protein